LASLLSYPVDLFLDRQLIEAREGQAKEQTDPAVENHKGVAVGLLDCFARAIHGGGIRNSPMRGHGLARPDGTYFVGGLVTHGEDEIQLRRSGFCELIPILAAQAIHGQARDSKLIECLWPHEPRGMATRTVGFEAGRSFLIENRLSHD